MLNEIFGSGRVKLDLESTTKSGVFGELVETIAGSDTHLNQKKLLEAVTFRENKMNTMIMPGIAIPHGYCGSVPGIIGAMGFSRAGIEYDTRDKKQAHLFFMLLMDESSRERHLRALSRLLELLSSPDFTGIKGAETPREIYALLRRY